MAEYGKRRVAITGMGAVTGFGEGLDIFKNGILSGKSAIRHFDLYPPDLFPTHIAAQAPKSFLTLDEIPLTRSATLALVTAREAIADARLDFQKTDVALSSAIGWGSPALHEIEAIRELCDSSQNITEVAAKMGDDYAIRVSTGYGQDVLRKHFRFTGPILSSLSACAASTQALGEAAALIRNGEVSAALAGGADSRLHPLGIIGYSLLGALTTQWNDAPEKGSRPFDKNHSGFVIGEGAGFLVLEEWEHAVRRGAKIHAEIISWSATTDAYRVTDPDPQGAGAARCMKLAIERANILPEQITYVNAHGTSTPANDRAECRALRDVFGNAIDRVAISSTKSMIGHLSMGAGAVETIAVALALKNGILPPTLNFSESEPEFPFDFVPLKPRTSELRYALKNSFGFGGQNASLVLAKA